ncbi:MAG: MoaD/ThiS family protein [Candidatus Omnitrophica bacterium]|nr:MoaD/ThiS family protein [Candidatus Omnitrophota bacterium]MCB9748140.1 MoaD/ThiS family protein [Candidatus Omnitrophota bacterium]
MNSKRIHIQYYAFFRELCGRSEEILETSAQSPSEIFKQFQRRYPSSLSQQDIKVAVNDEFVSWSTVLQDGDSVAFIPPVAGG